VKQRRVRLLKRLLKRRAIQRRIQPRIQVEVKVEIQLQTHVPTQRATQFSIRPDEHRDILRETRPRLRREVPDETFPSASELALSLSRGRLGVGLQIAVCSGRRCRARWAAPSARVTTEVRPRRSHIRSRSTVAEGKQKGSRGRGFRSRSRSRYSQRCSLKSGPLPGSVFGKGYGKRYGARYSERPDVRPERRRERLVPDCRLTAPVAPQETASPLTIVGGKEELAGQNRSLVSGRRRTRCSPVFPRPQPRRSARPRLRALCRLPGGPLPSVLDVPARAGR